jgi:hypothetical protein
LREVRSGRYDRVVLQEQSTLPVKNARQMHENVRLFDAAIRAAGARTVLYMTWARREARKTQPAITAAYLDIAAELGADVIPAGEVWARCTRARGSPESVPPWKGSDGCGRRSVLPTTNSLRPVAYDHGLRGDHGVERATGHGESRGRFVSTQMQL